MAGQNTKPQGLVFVDDDTWIWDMVKSALSRTNVNFIKIPSDVPLRSNWQQFEGTPFVIIHWENSKRPAGALIEEILEVERSSDPTSKIIVITTNPVHQDVVYFSELGLIKVIRVRNRDVDVISASKELSKHIIGVQDQMVDDDSKWRQLRVRIDRLPHPPSKLDYSDIEKCIAKLSEENHQKTARRLEAEAALALKANDPHKAARLALNAIDQNPNFFRAWNTLISAKQSSSEHQEAYALLQKMQLRNRDCVSRISAMGHTLIAMNDLNKAEQFFKSAMDRDPFCSSALNGMAEIKFLQHDLDAAKTLLSKSSKAHELAVKLNTSGVVLSRQGKYEEALQLYTDAQYVLPDQSRGHQIFYNIALCYAKWGKPNIASQFLRLALLKKPDYQKAIEWSARLEDSHESGQTADPDAA
jgi:tetratricopeptide (TPR) repeat protein